MDFPIVLDNDLFPMQAFYNRMPARAFMRVLDAFSRSVGASFDDAGCEFPEELESGDEVFEGVRFYVFSEEYVANSAEFLRVLDAVAEMYLKSQSEDEAEVRELLDKISSRLLGRSGNVG